MKRLPREGGISKLFVHFNSCAGSRAKYDLEGRKLKDGVLEEKAYTKRLSINVSATNLPILGRIYA